MKKEDVWFRLRSCMASSWGSVKEVFHSESKDQLLCIKRWMSVLLPLFQPSHFFFHAVPQFPSLQITAHYPKSWALLQLPAVADFQSRTTSFRASFPFLLRANMERHGRMLGRLPHVRASMRFLLQPRTNWVVRSWWEWGDGVNSFAKNKQDNKPTLMPTEEHNLTLSICKWWCLLPPLWGQVSWL